jgi:signal transduction histidine kinase
VYLENDMAGDNQERISQDMQFIHGAADKMKLLLDELLEMCRIDRVKTPPVTVSLRDVLTDVLGTMAGIISERNAEIHMPDSELMLFGDRSRLCQIWQNLIENAIKYSLVDRPPRIELGILRE